MQKGFDIGKPVKVKITDTGIKFLREKHEKLHPNVPFTPPKTDENSTFQLWRLMATFGEAFMQNMVFGPIYSQILIDEKDLVDL